MRNMSKTGLDLIKRFEGFSPTVYICPAGYPTIGYGHVVNPDERQQFASGITSEQAEALLRQDVQIAERSVLRLITVPLTDGQFDGLVSFTFNLGEAAGGGSKNLLRPINPFRVILRPKDLFLNHGANNMADHDVALLNFGGFA